MTTDNDTRTGSGDKGQAGGDGAKMVPESDLLAVKSSEQGFKRDLANARIELDQAKSRGDENYQLLLQERAAKEQFEAQVKQHIARIEELGAVEKERDALKTEREQASQGMLDLKYSAVSKEYNIPIEQLKEKAPTMDKLNDFEAALQLAAGHKTGGFDTGAGGTGGTTMLTQHEKAKQELEFARSEQGRKVNRE